MNLWRFIAAATLSELGLLAAQACLLLELFRVAGGNTRLLGILVLAQLLPLASAPAAGGALASRYPRSRIVASCELARIPALGIALVAQEAWSLIAIQLVLSCLYGLALPSRQAMVPELVTGDEVLGANSLDSVGRAGAQVVGPFLGATAYAATGDAAPILLGALVACLATSALLPRIPPSSLHGGPGRPWPVRRGALQILTADPALAGVAALSVVASLAVGALAPLLRPFVAEVLRGGDGTYATLLAAFGAGSLLGPSIGCRLAARIGLGNLILLAFVSEAWIMLLWSRTSYPLLSFALFALWGLNNFAMLPCQASFVHLRVPGGEHGRCFALLDQANYLGQLLAAGAVVLVGGLWSSPPLLTAAASLYALTALLVTQSAVGRAIAAPLPAPREAAENRFGGPILEARSIGRD